MNYNSIVLIVEVIVVVVIVVVVIVVVFDITLHWYICRFFIFGFTDWAPGQGAS